MDMMKQRLVNRGGFCRVMGLAVVVLCLAAGMRMGFAQTAPAADPGLGAGKVVGLDHFFNHQVKGGQQFHYVWEDTALSGFSKFGEVWKQFGATTAKLEKAP